MFLLLLFFRSFFRSFDFQKGTVKKHQNDEWSLSYDTNEPSNSTKVKRAKSYQILNLVNHAKCKLWPRFYLLTYGLEKCCMCMRGCVFFLFSSISGKQSHFDFHKAKHAQWHPPIATSIHISYNRNENCGMNIDQELICQAILLARFGLALLCSIISVRSYAFSTIRRRTIGLIKSFW